MSSEPYISNDLFITYSDLVLIQQYDTKALDNIINFSISKLTRKHIVIFVATELLEYYLQFLVKFEFPFVLITTCNDDFCVPYYHFPCKNNETKNRHDSLLENKYLLKWFTKNPSIIHDKLSPLPLGPKWQYHSNKFFGEDKKPIIDILDKYCLNPKKNFNEDKPNLLYVNLGQTTGKPFFESHKNIRQDMVNFFKDKFPLAPNCNFEAYLIEMKKYKFCLCPPGRGIDTHRAFESLMLGVIPIMISTPLDSLYEKLPVLIIDDWKKITQEFLEQEYEKIKNKNYDFLQLYSSYWKKRVQDLIN